MDLELDQHEMGNATLELLIKIHSQQHALLFTIAHLFAEGDEEKEDKIIDYYSEQYEYVSKQVIQDLYERRGSFGIDDVLNNGDNT